MAATIYDPETDSFVSVTSARGKVLAAQIAKPKPVVAAPAGGTDSQNAARLAAISKPVTIAPVKPATGTVTATGTATAQPIANEDVTKDVIFADLPPEEQAAINAINENAVVPTGSNVKAKEDIVINDSNGNPSIYTAPDGKIFTDLNLYNAYIEKIKLDEKRQRGQSAYELLYEEFDRYGLGSLVKEIEEFIKDGLSKSELTMKLRNTETYKKRFAANAERVKNGLAAISEAEYIGLEDQYQNIMRNYGLPESYYARGDFGTQAGFQKFIANDVSATELEERVIQAVERIDKGPKEFADALRQFYPEISRSDLLSYVLDPKNALTQIKSKVAAAEIGGSALQAGLTTNVTRAEEIAKAGITKQQAQQGFQTVAEVAPRGGQLAAMYGESPYTQQTAEQEVFGLAGSAEAAKQRKKLVGLERAEFSGQSGAAQGALGRERAGNF